MSNLNSMNSMRLGLAAALAGMGSISSGNANSGQTMLIRNPVPFDDSTPEWAWGLRSTGRVRARKGTKAPAGTKLARRWGWDGSVMHGGELTEAARIRAERRAKGLPVKGHAR